MKRNTDYFDTTNGVQTYTETMPAPTDHDMPTMYYIGDCSYLLIWQQHVPCIHEGKKEEEKKPEKQKTETNKRPLKKEWQIN